MYNDNQAKLKALQYAESHKSVNIKIINAVIFGIAEGYNTFSEQDCLGRLIKLCNDIIASQNMNYQMTGKADGILKAKAEKNLELLKQIEL